MVTRPAETGILRGITRTVLVELIAGEGLSLVERAFTVSEAKQAKEAFNSSATGVIMPVIAIDGAPIGGGQPGPIAMRLRQVFHDYAESSSGAALLK
jgi:D-alanine transaminase